MAPKKGSIAAAVARSRGSDPEPTTVSVAAAPVAGAPAPSPNAASTKPPSRQGTRQLVAHVDPVVLKQLKILAAEMDTTQAALIGQALNNLFEQHGKPRVANEQAAER